MTRLSKIPAKIAFSFCTLFCLWPCLAFSDDVDTAWVRRYNGPGNGDDQAVAIVVDSSGNVYVTGSSGDSTTRYDYCTIKYLPNGDTAWVRRYNGSANGDDIATSLAIDGSGNVYVPGSSGTIKYDPQGNPVWVQSLHGNVVVLDAGGNVYVAGANGVSKYDSQGNQLWVNSFLGRAIALDSSKNVYVIGTSIAKYDSLGNRLWIQPFAGVTIKLDPRNNVYAMNSGGIIKYDNNGNQIWVRDNLIGGWGGVTALALDNKGNAYVVGTFLNGEAVINWVTIKLDSLGNEFQLYDPDAGWIYTQFPTSIVVDTAGNVYATGREMWKYRTIKYDSVGNYVWSKFYAGPLIYDGGYPKVNIAYAITLDLKRNVYVTGLSPGDSSGNDFATIKYSPLPQLKGDLNLDGILNPFDVVLSLNCTFLGEPLPAAAPSACDLNCDGKVTPADVVILLNMVFASAPAPC